MHAEEILVIAQTAQKNTKYPLTPIVLGNAGIGKTSRITKAAQEAGYAPLVMTYDTLMDSIERIPSIQNEESVVVLDKGFKKAVIDSHVKTCLIIDEIQQIESASLNQTTLFRQLILERIILGTHKLGDDVIIIILGNSASHAGTGRELQEILPAMLWQNLLQLELSAPTTGEWLEYKNNCKLAEKLVAVLGSNFPESFSPRMADQLIHLTKNAHVLDYHPRVEVFTAFSGKALGQKLHKALMPEAETDFTEEQIATLKNSQSAHALAVLVLLNPKDALPILAKRKTPQKSLKVGKGELAAITAMLAGTEGAEEFLKWLGV